MFTIPPNFVVQFTPPIETMSMVGKLLVGVAWETLTTINKFGMGNFLQVWKRVANQGANHSELEHNSMSRWQ